jgi:hypothetical protein
MRCLRLPFTFEPARLRADLDLVPETAWIPHVQRRHYDGRWSGAALRSIAGTPGNLVPEAHGDQRFADTPLLARCGYFRAVLAHFRCPLNAVRLLRLHAGSSIAEHVDNALDFEDGEVRIHIPIITSEGVRFILDGARLVLSPGECWYTNVNLPHAVENTGDVDRIHLVLDCVVDDWLRAVFRTTPRPAPDNFRATLRTDAAAATTLLSLLPPAAAQWSSAAGAVDFRVDRSTYVLRWIGRYSWQLRLRVTPDVAGASVTVESSPDPARAHAPRFDALLALLRAHLHPTQVEIGLPQ